MCALDCPQMTLKRGRALGSEESTIDDWRGETLTLSFVPVIGRRYRISIAINDIV